MVGKHLELGVRDIPGLIGCALLEQLAIFDLVADLILQVRGGLVY